MLLNIGLNLYFLVILKLRARYALGEPYYRRSENEHLGRYLLVFRGPYALRWPLVRALWHFGGPIAMATLLSLTMHQADRYLLRVFLDMDRAYLLLRLYHWSGHQCTLPGAVRSDLSVEVYEIATAECQAVLCKYIHILCLWLDPYHVWHILV